jgi:hypothetical protein
VSGGTPLAAAPGRQAAVAGLDSLVASSVLLDAPLPAEEGSDSDDDDAADAAPAAAAPAATRRPAGASARASAAAAASEEAASSGDDDDDVDNAAAEDVGGADGFAPPMRVYDELAAASARRVEDLSEDDFSDASGEEIDEERLLELHTQLRCALSAAAGALLRGLLLLQQWGMFLRGCCACWGGLFSSAGHAQRRIWCLGVCCIPPASNWMLPPSNTPSLPSHTNLTFIPTLLPLPCPAATGLTSLRRSG